MWETRDATVIGPWSLSCTTLQLLRISGEVKISAAVQLLSIIEMGGEMELLVKWLIAAFFLCFFTRAAL